MSDESSIPLPQQRRRSNSLPIPQIEISVYHGPATTGSSRDSPTGSSITKDCIEVPGDVAPPTVQPAAVTVESTEPPLLMRRRTIGPDDSKSAAQQKDGAAPKKRRVKMTDLRTLIETRMFSKSERTLERVGLEAVVASATALSGQATAATAASAADMKIMEGTARIDADPHMSTSHHSSLDTADAATRNVLSRDARSNMLKGKSMPSLR